LSPGFTFTWERKPGGLIAIGNDTAAGTAPGQSLLESPDYTSLLAKAEVPDGATVAAFVQHPRNPQLYPVEIDPNVRPLGGVLEWTNRTATRSRSGYSSRSNSRAGGAVLAERHPQRRADLAQRRVRLDAHDRRHQIAAATRNVGEPSQGGRGGLAVAAGAKPLQPLALSRFQGRRQTSKRSGEGADSSSKAFTPTTTSSPDAIRRCFS